MPPDRVTTIGANALFSCRKLSSIVWPTSITFVDGEGQTQQFNNCSKLHELAGSANPEDIVEYLKNALTPLMKLCCYDQALEALSCVFEEDPEAIKQSDACRRTPLSYYCQHGSSEDVLKWLIEKYPDAANGKDDIGNNPLHFLYGNSLRSGGMLKLMIDANPSSVNEKNDNGRTPIHVHESAFIYKDGDDKMYEGKRYIRKVVIDATVTEIAANAFKECSNLEAVDWGQSKVEKIGDGAFFNTLLKEVYIPDSVKEIGTLNGNDGAFGRCNNLEKVVLGRNCEIIGKKALASTNIDVVVMHEGVKSIGSYASINCANLSTIVWPKIIETVKEYFSDGCHKLHELMGTAENKAVIDYLERSTTPL